VDVGDGGGLCWSDPREEAIGFVSAGMRLDGGGRVEDVRVAGDFFQHRPCGAELAAQLRGHLPDMELIGRALDAVYAARAGLIEGVRSLSTLHGALWEAAERALAGHARD
jgi:hypothetical protein